MTGEIGIIKRTKHLYFVEAPALRRNKTQRWTVRSVRSGTQLGTIKWHAPWRQYCYFDDINALYSRGCLRDIAEFLEEQMVARGKTPPEEET